MLSEEAMISLFLSTKPKYISTGHNCTPYHLLSTTVARAAKLEQLVDHNKRAVRL